jgi:osmotically-inducible protein OsmY
MYSAKNFLLINFAGLCSSLLLTSNTLANQQQPPQRFVVQSSKWSETSTSHYAEIQLRAVLATNPVLSHYNINASISKEKARLSGQVRSENEKELAEIIAKSIPSIKEVKNNITVNKNYEPGTSPSWVSAITDATITAMIKSAYLLNPIINTGNISVTTANGTVTLTGKASSEEEKTDAENMAIHIPGVITVKNNISLQPTYQSP